MSIQAAKSLGGQFVGIDIVAEDITSAHTSGNAFIMDVNTTPGLVTQNVDPENSEIDYVE